MKICVIGLGYIGLPTALLLAKRNKVVGFDTNKELVGKLKKGKIMMQEQGLMELFKKVRKNLSATNTVEEAEVFIVCVPTPLNKKKKCDLSFIRKAAKDISKVLKKGNLVILESTVPPGTTRNFFGKIIEKESGLKPGEDFFLSYVSEKAIPGKILFEIENNARIVGAINKKSFDLTKKIYSSFVKGKIIKTEIELAEISKLMENTYRDVNIALANEFKRICDALGIEVNKAIELANLHPRVNILKPSIGVGGYCLTKDPWFLIEKTKHGNLIRISRKINDTQTEYTLDLIKKILKKEKIKHPVVGLLSLAYKPGVSDLRESSMLKIYYLLKKEKIKVLATDPLIKEIKGISIEKKSEVIKRANILLDHYNIYINKKIKE